MLPQVWWFWTVGLTHIPKTFRILVKKLNIRNFWGRPRFPRLQITFDQYSLVLITLLGRFTWLLRSIHCSITALRELGSSIDLPPILDEPPYKSWDVYHLSTGRFRWPIHRIFHCDAATHCATRPSVVKDLGFDGPRPLLFWVSADAKPGIPGRGTRCFPVLVNLVL